MTQYVCLEAVEANGISSVYAIVYCCPEDKTILHMQRKCSAAELAVDVVNIVIDQAVTKGCAGVELRIEDNLYDPIIDKSYHLGMPISLGFRIVPDVTEYDRKLLEICKRLALGNLSLYSEVIAQ